MSTTVGAEAVVVTTTGNTVLILEAATATEADTTVEDMIDIHERDHQTGEVILLGHYY